MPTPTTDSIKSSEIAHEATTGREAGEDEDVAIIAVAGGMERAVAVAVGKDAGAWRCAENGTRSRREDPPGYSRCLTPFVVGESSSLGGCDGGGPATRKSPFTSRPNTFGRMGFLQTGKKT